MHLLGGLQIIQVARDNTYIFCRTLSETGQYAILHTTVTYLNEFLHFIFLYSLKNLKNQTRIKEKRGFVLGRQLKRKFGDSSVIYYFELTHCKTKVDYFSSWRCNSSSIKSLFYNITHSQNRSSKSPFILFSLLFLPNLLKGL